MGRLLGVGLALVSFHLLWWEEHGFFTLLGQFLLGMALAGVGGLWVACSGLFLFGGGEGLVPAALVAAVLAADSEPWLGKKSPYLVFPLMVLLWVLGSYPAPPPGATGAPIKPRINSHAAYRMGLP